MPCYLDLCLAWDSAAFSQSVNGVRCNFCISKTLYIDHSRVTESGIPVRCYEKNLCCLVFTHYPVKY